MDFRPCSPNIWKTQEKEPPPPGETEGTGDPTDPSCSHTRAPEPGSRLSPGHAPGSQSTTWGDAGPRTQSCPERTRSPRRRAVTGLDARGLGCRPSTLAESRRGPESAAPRAEAESRGGLRTLPRGSRGSAIAGPYQPVFPVSPPQSSTLTISRFPGCPRVLPTTLTFSAGQSATEAVTEPPVTVKGRRHPTQSRAGSVHAGAKHNPTHLPQRRLWLDSS